MEIVILGLVLLLAMATVDLPHACGKRIPARVEADKQSKRRWPVFG